MTSKWTEEYKSEFFAFLLENSDLNPEAAMELTEYKACIDDEVQGLANALKLGKIIPLDVVARELYGKNKDEINSYLWNIGFDTKQYTYVIDVACYTWNNNRNCGKVIYGAERLDNQWLNTIIEGNHVASLEARYHKDMDTLYTMKSNTSVSKA